MAFCEMPHRDPLLAALLRCEDLREQVAAIDASRLKRRRAAVTLAQAIAEIAWLERELRQLEAKACEVEPEIDGIVRRLEETERVVASEEESRGGVRLLATSILVACVVSVVAFVAAFSRHDDTAAGGPSVPAVETTVHLSGNVISSAGPHVSLGERCDITIVDTGERDVGRSCTIEIRCPRAAQRIPTKSCPITGGPIRFETGSAMFDVPNRRATFLFQRDWDVTNGGATLQLD